MAKVKEQESIPVTKVQRATKFITTGARIGGNYLKHYGKKLVNPELTKDQLHQDNASDIYKSLSQLKGSALKIAQMLSMDKNLLPTAYQNQFALAQYSAPPLSYPLVVRTFEKYFKNGTVDLLSIDAEGVDFEIIQSLDFTNHQPKVICIESINYTPDGTGTKRIDLCSFIENAGYHEYANTNINSIFVQKNWWFGK